MANATTQFLQGANAANAAVGSSSLSPEPSLDSATVLAAISKPDVSSLETLATELHVMPGSVSPIVESLSREGLIQGSGDGELTLSESGERALRYTEISKTA
jgi:DNA-binding MarR family transcriptional regulator